MKKLFLLAFFFVLVSSCAKPIVDMTGDIHGIVKDYSDGYMISNCQVSLNPSGISTTTDNQGRYTFSKIEPGEYTIAFSKAGYHSESTKVTVISGRIIEASIMLQAKSPFALSEQTMDFGDFEASKAVYIYNNTDSDCSYTIENMPSWLSANTTRGIVRAGGTSSVTFSVDRSKLNYGSFSHVLIFNYSGKGSGSIQATVKCMKVQLTVPSVTTASSAENISQVSFDITGEILSTGGQQIVSHGHCWSLSPNPTIADQKTDLGATTKVGEYISTVSNLTTATTYYVRAYATNASGTSYGDQLAVMTNDVHSEKWDGSRATAFAGGTGTSSNPYIIKTGGQLALMASYSDKYFVLANNIDLNNNNWKPFEFKGTFDGKGYTLSNLYISRSDDRQGLFSILHRTGKVKNLTVKGVKINAPSSDEVGAIAGFIDRTAGGIIDCKVILTPGSIISGMVFVGGIAGSTTYDYQDSFVIINCQVMSQNDDVMISGETCVGGVIGDGGCELCHVSANIKGGTQVGGICGKAYYISASSFTGTIEASQYVGGIVGQIDYSSCIVKSCKAVAEIYVEDSHAGGITGYFTGNNHPGIIACYADGHLYPESSSVDYLGGIAGYYNSVHGYIEHSYSTIVCTSDKFDGISDGQHYYPALAYDSCTINNTNVEGDNNEAYCTDINSFMKSCYSEHSNLWNYNSTWTWTGKINGVQKTVQCPKLAWE